VKFKKDGNGGVWKFNLNDTNQIHLTNLFFLSKKNGMDSGIDFNIVEAFCKRYKHLDLIPLDTYELLLTVFNRVMEK